MKNSLFFAFFLIPSFLFYQGELYFQILSGDIEGVERIHSNPSDRVGESSILYGSPATPPPKNELCASFFKRLGKIRKTRTK